MTDAELKARSRLRCREIMTKAVTTASPKDTLQDVSILLRDKDIGSVPVVADGKLAGIVTDRDIVIRGVAEGVENDAAIRTVMTSEVFTVKGDDFVFEAVRLMGDKQIRRIPVVSEDGSLAGIIALADVALEVEDDKELAEALEEISSGAGFWGRK